MLDEEDDSRYLATSETRSLRDDWWVVEAGRSMPAILSPIRLSRTSIGSVPDEAGVVL